MTVSNIADAPKGLSPSNQKLIDAQGRSFSPDTAAALNLDSDVTFWDEINPGNTVTMPLVFDMPVDAVPSAIELHDSMFSGGVTVGTAHPAEALRPAVRDHATVAVGDDAGQQVLAGADLLLRLAAPGVAVEARDAAEGRDPHVAARRDREGVERGLELVEVRGRDLVEAPVHEPKHAVGPGEPHRPVGPALHVDDPPLRPAGDRRVAGAGEAGIGRHQLVEPGTFGQGLFAGLIRYAMPPEPPEIPPEALTRLVRSQICSNCCRE